MFVTSVLIVNVYIVSSWIYLGRRCLTAPLVSEGEVVCACAQNLF